MQKQDKQQQQQDAILVRIRIPILDNILNCDQALTILEMHRMSPIRNYPWHCPSLAMIPLYVQ